jgi:hypothetical protein
VRLEALTNVARHSGRHEAELMLTDRNGRLTLTFRDWGPVDLAIRDIMMRRMITARGAPMH